MSRKRIFYFVFFCLLTLGFFVALAVVVPGYLTPKMHAISEVQPFHFLDQNGKSYTSDNTKGKVQVVNFFFTTCTSVCPRMNNNIRPLFDEFRNEPDFLMLSYTCDPSRDSVPVMKRYADSIGADGLKWVFLTGNKDSLYSMARNSYTIDDPKSVKSTETDFLHSQFIALVNKDQQVVKIYDGLRPSEIKELRTDIKRLLKEKS